MATPVANFTYTIDGLEVTFTDQSSDVDGPITAWSWNFGDGGTSTSEDPVHTYSDAGIYGVALQVTQGAETNTLIRYIAVYATAASIPVPIATMVAQKLPSSTLDLQLVLTLIQKYQLLLQNSPSTPIADALVFDESVWPSLFKVLIAELVVWEMLQILFGDLLASGGVIGETIAGSDAGLTQGLKSVETGPAKVERYDLNQFLAGISESQANYFKTFFGSGTAIQEYKASICMLARRLGIFLSLCKGYNVPAFPTVVTPDTIYDGTNYDGEHPLTNL